MLWGAFMKKRLISIVVAIALVFSNLSVASAINFYDTDYLSVEVFSRKLASLIGDYNNESNDNISEASVENTDEKSTNRLIVKSDEKLDPLDSVAYLSGYDDLHILQFDSTASYKSAYDYYDNLACVDYVAEDGILSEAVIDEGVVVESTVNSPTSVASNIFGYTVAKQNASSNFLVNVAVIDSGVQNDHEFLVGRVDPTGFSSVPNVTSCYDDRGHGTQVAGVIVANTNSNVRIMPYKALDKWGEGAVSQVVLAIDAAIEADVDIINLSMQMSGRNTALHEAVQRAYNNGIYVVVAAGNSGKDLSNYPYSPGVFSEAISVMSCNNQRRISSFSNYGTPADYVAPGEDILSPTINNKYKISSGTSLAAPFICAAVSYILGKSGSVTDSTLFSKLDSQSQYCYGSPTGKCVYPATAISITEPSDAPVFLDEGCKFIGSMYVEITGPEGAQILYSLDGDTYDDYSEPFLIDQTCVVKAFCLVGGKYHSEIIGTTFVKQKEGLEDFVVDENGTLIGYNGTETTVKVPSFYNGIKIRSVASGVFSGNSPVTSVTFENSLYEVGEGAFKDNVNLTSFNAPALKVVSADAFYGCVSLSSLTLEQLETVGDNAFKDCTLLTSIDADNIKHIGENAFENSGITDINLIYLLSIGARAFMNCKNLPSVTFYNITELPESVFENCTNLSYASFKEVTRIPNRCFVNCSKLTTVDGAKVTEVGDSSFENCKYYSHLYLPSLSVVGNRAFYNTGITDITLGTITSYGFNAFAKCTSLFDVIINSIDNINADTFEGCVNLKNLYYDEDGAFDTNGVSLGEFFPYITNFYGSNITSIGDNVFSNCVNLKSISAPYLVKVGNSTFRNTDLTSYSSGIKEIGEYAFADNSKMTSLSLSSAELSFSANSFENCSALTTVTLNNIKTLPEGMLFYNCFPNMTKFTSSGLETLPDNLFKDCSKLSSLNMSFVRTIGSHVFANCRSLKTVSLSASSVAENAFDQSTIETLYLNSLYTLNGNEFGSSKNTIKTLQLKSLTEMGSGVFQEFSKLTSITLTNLKSVPKNAFRNAPLLDYIDVSGATSIGENAISGCKKLATFNGNCLTSIPANLFEDCVLLKSVNLDKLNELPKEGMFADYEKLTTFNADRLSVIPANTFKNCVLLKNVNCISLQEIGEYAFYNTAVTDDAAFSNVKRVDDYAFSKTPLTVFVATKLEYLGDGAFSECQYLNTVNMSMLTQVPKDAFNNSITLYSVRFGALTLIDENAFSNTIINSFSFSKADELSIMENAFYNAHQLSNMDLKNVSYLGPNAFYGTKLNYNKLVMPKLKTIEVDSFNGITIENSLVLENVEKIYDLPSGECKVFIGSDCDYIDIMYESVEIYSPAGTYASQYCIENKLNYTELNDETAIVTQCSDTVDNNTNSLTFSVQGFNVSYKWYGANREDLSDSVNIGSGSQKYIKNDIVKYKYYYCVATDTENENVYTRRSVISTSNNIVLYFESDKSYIIYDEYGYGDHYIVSDENDYDSLLNSIIIPENATIEVTPSYSHGNANFYGTGSVISLYNADNELVNSYTLAITGDINGDGYVDVLDCSQLASYVNFHIDMPDMTFAQYYAMDIYKDDCHDEFDYQAIVNKSIL